MKQPSKLTLRFENTDTPVLRSTEYDSGDGHYKAELAGRQPRDVLGELADTPARYMWRESIRAFAWAIVRFVCDRPTARFWSREATASASEDEQSALKTLAQDIEHDESATINRLIFGDVQKIFPIPPTRTRSRQKHLPITVAIDGDLLPHSNVRIFVDDGQISNSEDLRMLSEKLLIQGKWSVKRAARQVAPRRTPEERTSPIRTLDAPVGDFTGRDDEKQKLISALRSRDGVRIIMIHGMPGSGKTQLALVVAREIGSLFPGHHLVVKLRFDRENSAHEALTVALRSLKGFGFDLPQDVDELRNFYLRSLAETKSLVLVDNAVETEMVEKLVPPDGCGLIVTSRERIAIDGPVAERIGRLDQLKPPEAESLLRRICPRVSSSIGEKICRYCGYLPLAIRAAGNLLDTTVDLEPAQYAGELENEHDRLDRIGHTGVPIGVEASFNLSYERLDPKTKKVFQTLAVFPASFNCSAEAAVCDDIDNAHLHELVRRALVNFSEASKRYALHDLMRLFAAKQLGTDRDAVMKRYAEHFLSEYERSDHLFAGDEHALREGYDLFVAERVNILTAWRWCADNSRTSSEIAELCCRFAYTGQRVAGFFLPSYERIALYDASVTAARCLEPSNITAEYRGDATRRLARAHYDSGSNLQLSTRLYQEALQIAESIKDLGGQQSALGMLARNRMRQAGKDRRLKEAALEMQIEAYRLAVELGDRSIEMQAAGHLGDRYREFDKPLEAIRYFQKELDLSRQPPGKPRAEAQALSGMSRAYFQTGQQQQRARAIETAEQALEIAERVDDEKTINQIATNLGRWYRKMGNPAKALPFSERSLELNQKQGNRKREAGALIDCGMTLAVLGEDDKAIEAFEAAISIARDPLVSDRHTEGVALGELAKVVAKGDPQLAIERAEQAYAIAESEGDEHRRFGLKRNIEYWRRALR